MFSTAFVCICECASKYNSWLHSGSLLWIILTLNHVPPLRFFSSVLWGMWGLKITCTPEPQRERAFCFWPIDGIVKCSQHFKLCPFIYFFYLSLSPLVFNFAKSRRGKASITIILVWRAEKRRFLVEFS